MGGLGLSGGVLDAEHLGEALIAVMKQSAPLSVLDDYANVIAAALALHEVTGARAYRDDAERAAEAVETYFADPAGGYFFTAHDAADLIVRTKHAHDAAMHVADPDDVDIDTGEGPARRATRPLLVRRADISRLVPEAWVAPDGQARADRLHGPPLREAPDRADARFRELLAGEADTGRR